MAAAEGLDEIEKYLKNKTLKFINLAMY